MTDLYQADGSSRYSIATALYVTGFSYEKESVESWELLQDNGRT
jgi:hypothetical protein